MAICMIMKTTNQELVEWVKEYTLGFNKEDNWFLDLMKASLAKAKNNIDLAIEIFYENLGHEMIFGSCGPDCVREEANLTGKTTGEIRLWTADNPDKFFSEPDLVLTNKDLFILVRDGNLPVQENLF